MDTLPRAVARVARGPLRMISHTCDLCGERIPGSGYYFAEAGTEHDPPSNWILCETCAALVTQQLERIRPEAKQRLRIAVGLAASDRGVTRVAPSPRRSDDTGFNRLLVAVVYLAFIVHAAAFILVVVVIATAH